MVFPKGLTRRVSEPSIRYTCGTIRAWFGYDSRTIDPCVYD